MFSTSQTNRRSLGTAAASSPARTAFGPRLLIVAAVGLLSLSACSNANDAGDAGDAGASSSPAGTSGSSEAQESASQDTGAIDPGAADVEWKEQARQAASEGSTVDANQCVDGLLDQKTLDAVATAMPEVGTMYLGGLYTHAGCIFTAANGTEEDPKRAAATIEIRRYYLANDEEDQTLDESGFLKHGQCADDVEKNENGVSTVNKHGVKETPIPGAAAAVELQAAWHCSDDGATSSAVLIHAANDEEDGFPDPAVLAESDLAVETATHLFEAESEWAPAMDGIYEQYFKDILGQ